MNALRRFAMSAFTGRDPFHLVLAWADLVGAVTLSAGCDLGTHGVEWYVEVGLPFRPSSASWSEGLAISNGALENERLRKWQERRGEEPT